MSTGYDIITYGGGQVLTLLFNGITTAVGDNNYSTLIRISGLFGLAWVLMESTFRNQFILNIKWFLGFVLLYNALLVPKVTVHVVDRLQHNQLTTIANVPWGLAFFASITSEIGDHLTRLTEQNFALPDDLKYNQTGTLMASNLIKSASHFEITNPTFAHNMREFMQQCVFYDIWLNKYTLQDLVMAPDIWLLISAHASPARAFPYNRQIVTCQQGIGLLNKDWQAELLQAGFIYGKRLFPQSTQDQRSQLLKYLPISYNYLTDLSEDASTLMRQNMLANAIEQSVIGQAASHNATAAIQAYAVSRAQELKRSTYQITGELAARWLPIMKTVFEALFYGAFLFLFLLMLLPIGASIFRTYVMSLFWLQSWAPLYAILNLVMTVDARMNSLAATSQGTGHALSFATLSGLAQVNSDTAALAGYLSMSIPFIAYGIVKGGAGAMTQLASYVSHVSQSAATSAGNEATTGNFSLGNTQFSNHSANNTSSNHLNTNASLESGLFSYQTPSGAMIHRTPSGNAVIDNRNTTLSNVGTSVNLADSVRATASQQYEQATTASLSHMQAYTQSTGAVLRGIYDLASSQGHSASLDNTSTLSQSASQTTNVEQAKELIHRFATENRLNDTQAVQILGVASAQIGGSITKKFPMLDPDLKYGISAGAGAKVHIQGFTEAQKQQAIQAGHEFINRTHFTETIENAVRSIQDKTYRSSNDTSQHLVASINSAYDEGSSHRKEVINNLQAAESYRQMVNYATENALQINTNNSQEFVNWLQKQPAPNSSSGQMGRSNAEFILSNDPETARYYAGRFAEEKTSSLITSFVEKHNFKTSQDIQATYGNNNSHLPNTSDIALFDRQIENKIQSQALQMKTGNQQLNQNDVGPITQQLEQNVSRSIQSKEKQLALEAQQLQVDAVQNSDPKKHDLSSRAGHDAKEAIKSIFISEN